MPARPAKVSGLAPMATPSRVISQAPRGDGGLGVVPRPELVDGAGHDGNDVLERSRELYTDQVAVAVQAEGPSAEDLRHSAATASSGEATTAPPPGRVSISGARLGPERAATRAAPPGISSAMT